MSEPLLRVKALRVSFGAREILRGVDFALAEGEAVALLGPNGSGKSTCLNAISGLVAIAGGQVEVDGTSISGWPVHRVVRHGVVQVSQSRDLFPDLSVEDNLRLGGHTRSVEQMDGRLPEVYSLFPKLRERRAQLVRSLSGGEQQMVAIGRALMSRPRLLLLDEPSLGLAPLIVRQIFEAIGRIARDEGVTIFLVEQNAFHALRLADRGYVLGNGRVRLSGSGRELLANAEVRAAYLEGGHP